MDGLYLITVGEKEMGNNLYDVEDLRSITYMIAELCEYPYEQFYALVRGDKKLQETIMKLSINEYKFHYDQIISLPREEQPNEIVKLRNEIFKMTTEELINMWNRMQKLSD